MHLIFYKSNNSKLHSDVKHVFEPESRLLFDALENRSQRAQRLAINTSQINQIGRKEMVKKAISFHPHISSLNFFCHGWRTGIQLWGQGIGEAEQLADLIAARRIPIVNLFACHCAKQHPKGSFLDWVWERLVSTYNPGRENCQLIGHHIKGHATWNPRVEIYFVDSIPFHMPLFSKSHDKDLFKRWDQKLKHNSKKGIVKTDGCVMFPFYVSQGYYGPDLLERM